MRTFIEITTAFSSVITVGSLLTIAVGFPLPSVNQICRWAYRRLYRMFIGDRLPKELRTIIENVDAVSQNDK